MAPTPDQQAFTEATAPQSSFALDPISVAQIVAATVREYQANLSAGNANPQSNFVPIGPIDLTTAPLTPLALPSPIKAVYFQDATDNTVKVKLVLGTNAKFAVDSALPLGLNDSVNFGNPIPSAYLTWTAQAGKTATLYLAIDAEFRSGRINSVQSGGVSVIEGLAVTTKAPVSVTGVATQILAADSGRVVTVIENQGMNAVYLGDATVAAKGDAAKPGITLNPGDVYHFKNAGALYGITAGTAEPVAAMDLK